MNPLARIAIILVLVFLVIAWFTRPSEAQTQIHIIHPPRCKPIVHPPNRGMHALPVRQYLGRLSGSSRGGGFRLPHKFVEPRLIVNPFVSEKPMSKVSKVVVISIETVQTLIVNAARIEANLIAAETGEVSPGEFKLTVDAEKEIIGCVIDFTETESEGVKVCASVEFDKKEMGTLLIEAAKEHAGAKGLGSSTIHYETETADVLKEVVITFNKVGK